MDVDRLNDFFGSLAPGLHGVVFDESAPERVVGHIDVTDTLIAGTEFLFAPAIISLAGTLCAADERLGVAMDPFDTAGPWFATGNVE